MASIINTIVVGFSVLFGSIVFNVILKKNPIVSLIAAVLIGLGTVYIQSI